MGEKTKLTITGLNKDIIGNLKVEVTYCGSSMLKTQQRSVKGIDLQVVLNEMFEAILRSLDQMDQGNPNPDRTVGLQTKEYKDL